MKFCSANLLTEKLEWFLSNIQNYQAYIAYLRHNKLLTQHQNSSIIEVYKHKIRSKQNTLDIHSAGIDGAGTSADNEKARIPQMYLCDPNMSKNIIIISSIFTNDIIFCSFTLCFCTERQNCSLIPAKTRCLRASIATYLAYLAVRKAHGV